MHDSEFARLSDIASGGDVDELFDRLTATLRQGKDYHRLFDARMVRRKHELGLPLSRPTSFSDVPEDKRKAVEETYVAAAREVGTLLLEEGDIPAAWIYFQVIRDPEPVKRAIEALPGDGELDDRTERIMQIALYEQVHPVKGVRMMLQAHGTCSTITALDQAMPALTPQMRQECAKVMVRDLYRDLCDSVRRHVQDKLAMVPPGDTLREMITGRDWLFEGGNYHIDVSHLGSVVRFARSIDPPAEELDLALQMCEYGSRLDAPLQYGGEPPFQDFYPAHAEFFKVLLDRDREAALGSFRHQLEQEPDEQDKPLLAYVLVDLLVRTGEMDEAVEVASRYLTDLGEDVGFSFAELCVEAGRSDVLKQVMREKGDLVGYAAALLGEHSVDTAS